MKRLNLGIFVLTTAVLSSCGGMDTNSGATSNTSAPIAYGTADSTHTAVVALLANAGSGSFSECSGTIVQVRNGVGYVLTAAHCCNMTTPSLVVVSSDYSSSEGYLFGGTPQPPAYSVIPGSVYYDSRYNGQDHDFCMLQFNAPTTAAVIPVATPGNDGLAIGVQIEHVGFGATDTTTSNSGRRHGTNTVDLGLDALTITASQGGSSRTPGECEGDSGGPALVTAGTSQSSQKVVGVTSYGNSATCSAATVGVMSRVSSETGTGGFITNYLNDTPSGTQAGGATSDCQTCAGNAQSGACASQANACANDPNCLNLNQCLGACTDQTCANNCATQAGQTAVNELNAFDSCICNTACPTQCVTECGGSTGSDAGVGTDAGTGGTCNTCVTGAESSTCSGQYNACANDTNCANLSQCLGACSDQTCANNCATQAGATAVNELNAFDSCICNTACSSACSTECGGSTGSDAGTVDSCNTCANNAQTGACSAETNACAGDQACVTLAQCVGACTTQACANNCATQAGQTAVAEFNAFNNCICNTACPTECAAACGGSTGTDAGTVFQDSGVVRDAGTTGGDGGTTRDAAVPDGSMARNDGGTTNGDAAATGDGATGGDGGTSGSNHNGCACKVGAAGAGAGGNGDAGRGLGALVFGVAVALARRSRRRASLDFAPDHRND